MGIPEGEERERGAGNIWRNAGQEIPKAMGDIKPHICENLQTWSKMDTRKAHLGTS